jgi:hypothetical protein
MWQELNYLVSSSQSTYQAVTYTKAVLNPFCLTDNQKVKSKFCDLLNVHLCKYIFL